MTQDRTRTALLPKSSPPGHGRGIIPFLVRFFNCPRWHRKQILFSARALKPPRRQVPRPLSPVEQPAESLAWNSPPLAPQYPEGIADDRMIERPLLRPRETRPQDNKETPMRAQMKNATLLRNTIAYCMFRILSASVICGTLLPAVASISVACR